MNVQHLQPAFCQKFTPETQAVDSLTGPSNQSLLFSLGNQSKSSSKLPGTQLGALSKSGLSGSQLVGNPIPVLSGGISQQLAKANIPPKIDICTDDCFTGGTCLRLSADVVNCQFVKFE